MWPAPTLDVGAPGRGKPRPYEGGAFGCRRLRIADRQDLVRSLSAGRFDLYLVPDGLADESAGEGRTDRDQPLADVGFVRSDDAIGQFLVGVLVDDLHRGPEHDLVARHLARVDDLGAADLVFEFRDAAFGEGLALLGREIGRAHV